MNYTLSNSKNKRQKGEMAQALKKIAPLLNNEKINLAIAILAAFIGAAASLLDPIIIGRAVDLYIKNGDYRGVLISAAILLGVYVIGLVATYIQTLALGGVGRRVLFGLRNELFCKLQELPVAFFNQNKSGDLISRINNDTDKLNQFISHALMQFMRSSFTVAGAGIFLLSLNPRLGAAALIPAALVLIITRLLASWVERANLKSLQSIGQMSSEIQESLANFKVVAAFNRLDYFKSRFNDVNKKIFPRPSKRGSRAISTPRYTVSLPRWRS